jgi:hypothetical protein
MRQDETKSLFRMKLIRSLFAVDTASTRPLTYEDGVWHADFERDLPRRKCQGFFAAPAPISQTVRMPSPRTATRRSKRFSIPRSATVRQFARVPLSASGSAQLLNVCFWHLADISAVPSNVRFWG